MGLHIYCAICQQKARRYYSTLDCTIWAVCEDHTYPFKDTAIELDPEKYDIESYFEEFLDDYGV